ncbi:MAG: hypothetical protein F4062_06050, partial [Acidimicrobiia bacterium]|nr:hypothetical protein [Acidimicrobiia bacterium]
VAQLLEQRVVDGRLHVARRPGGACLGHRDSRTRVHVGLHGGGFHLLDLRLGGRCLFLGGGCLLLGGGGFGLGGGCLLLGGLGLGLGGGCLLLGGLGLGLGGGRLCAGCLGGCLRVGQRRLCFRYGLRAARSRGLGQLGSGLSLSRRRGCCVRCGRSCIRRGRGCRCLGLGRGCPGVRGIGAGLRSRRSGHRGRSVTRRRRCGARGCRGGVLRHGVLRGARRGDQRQRAEQRQHACDACLSERSHGNEPPRVVL